MSRSAWMILLLLISLPAGATAAPAEYHVMMLLYRGCEEACQGFQDYFRRQRIPVRFTLRDAAQDKSRIAGLVAEAKRTRPDLVVTWGTTVSLETVGRWDAVDPARHITDLPVLFMIVSQPVELGLVPTLASSRRNVAGSLYLLPVEEQLRAARRSISISTGSVSWPTRPKPIRGPAWKPCAPRHPASASR